MIYYCNNCTFFTEIDTKKLKKGTEKLPTFCPHCKSTNVCLKKKKRNRFLIFIWFLAGGFFFGMIPTISIAEMFKDNNESLYTLFCFMTFFVSPFIVAFAPIFIPRFIKRIINKKRYKTVKEILEKKEYKLAEKKYTDIIALNMWDSGAFFERGKIRLKTHKPALAVNDFTIASLINTDNMDYLYFKALALMKHMDEEKTKEAIDVFSTLISNGHLNSKCFNYRGECYSSIGIYYKALEDFEKAVKLEPDNQKFINNKNSVMSKLAGYHNNSKQYSPDEIQQKRKEKEPIKNNEPLNNDFKINLADCSKEELMKLDVFDDKKAEKFISDRDAGKNYYDIYSLIEEFNIQPHQVIDIENHLIFPKKKSTKKGRTIDF